MLDVSIIIVNWNTRDLLIKCLGLVYSTITGLSFEVIVVDNASTDNSVSAARKLFPGVQFIENTENSGFAQANNQAIEVSQGRFLLLLNTDTFVYEGAIKIMVTFMDAHPAVGAAGCRLYYEDGSLQRSCSSFPTVLTELWQILWLDRIFPSNRVFGTYMMTYWAMDDFREVDAVIGACMMLRQEAIKQVGLLDDQFFMYSEEVDLCYRLKQAGWKIYFVPNAEAIHLWGGSSHKIKRESFLRLYKSRVQFFRKHYGKFTTGIYKLLLLLSGLLRVTAGAVFLLIRRDQSKVHTYSNYLALVRYVWKF